MKAGLIDSIAETISTTPGPPEEIARRVMEVIASYYEGGLEKVDYGNLAASSDNIEVAKAVASEMRRILAA